MQHSAVMPCNLIPGEMVMLHLELLPWIVTCQDMATPQLAIMPCFIMNQEIITLPLEIRRAEELTAIRFLTAPSSGIGQAWTLPTEEEDPRAELAMLKEKIKQLEDQLEYEKLRSEAYETMIRIAEKEFKLPIKKKFGAKQSRNSGVSDPNQG